MADRPHMVGMNPVRAIVERQIDSLVGPSPNDSQFDLSTGDDGLFGPGSVAWDVHGDFATMMVGGVAALLLQMLHPGALAGVWDHSDFRRDMRGRLRRTARFVGGTTYASTEQAEAMIDRVRRIHDRVAGTLPDGTPYSATDPVLLTWVHVAESASFLAAYRRYRDPIMTVARQDRYFAEVAVVARRLGATDIPETSAAVDAYLEAMRPQLRADERTRTIARALFNPPADTLAMKPMQSLTMAAGIDLLPPWAVAMHGLTQSRPHRHLVRAGAASIGMALRWALSDRTARKNALLRARSSTSQG
ncbi:oxygenase MpaB family protein [Sphingomonas sp. UYAg733]